MKRKLISKVGVASLAAFLALAGCTAATTPTTAPTGAASPGTSATPEGPATPITMLVLGDKPTNGRLEAMLDALNVRLKEQANASLSLYYVEWADWQTQYNTTLLAGDSSIDLIGTATDWLYAWENSTKGAFLPLTEDMVKTNAPQTWAKVDALGDWPLTKLPDGNIYFLPEDEYTQWTNHGFFYRGDWAKEAGIADGTITKFEDFTTYFTWVKQNQPDAYPWDVAGQNQGALDGYIQGHTDYQLIQQVSSGIYYPFQTTTADPYTVTSWLMEGDTLEKAATLTKEWNDLGVWREDSVNYDGDTREELYAGLSGTDQHHTQTFVTQIWTNLSTKQPGSDPKFFYWGSENGNFYRDLKTHGAMAVSAYSKNPEKALQVYDLIRNDQEDYMLFNYGIEGTDYIINADGTLGRPEGYDSSTDGLGSNFWYGRRDEFEPKSATLYDKVDALYAELDSKAKDYPYSTFVLDHTNIDTYLAAMGAVLSEYLPQFATGKFDDPAAAVAEMRTKLEAAGYNEAKADLQAQIDAWATSYGLK